MSLQLRLKEFLAYKNLTYKAFEEICGFGNGTAKRFNEKIKDRTVNSIVSVFPDLNRKWLLTGEGDMIASEKQSIPHVPLLNLDVRGGFDDNTEAGGEYIQRMVPFPGAVSGDFAVEVSGNSMYPVIPSGSRLLLRPVDCWSSFLEMEQLYVFELSDYRRLLKHARRSDLPDHIQLISYNPDNPPQDLPLSIVRRVYKVVGQYTHFGF